MVRISGQRPDSAIEISAGTRFSLCRRLCPLLPPARQVNQREIHESHSVPSAEVMPPQTGLRKLSIVIPAMNEADCIESTVEHLHLELKLKCIEHEIIVVDDHSQDETFAKLQAMQASVPTLRPIRNPSSAGFGQAVRCGFSEMQGDAVVIFMADESDDVRDVPRYWETLQQYDCAFGSRFIKGGGVIDYPWFKMRLNRLANTFIRLVFGIRYNDFTNAFKGYRREVIEGCYPMLSPHFNLTVELPLKAMVRGFSWHVLPITWRNRRSGVAKLKIREMGSRYFFVVAHVWLEKYFSRGDYHRDSK